MLEEAFRIERFFSFQGWISPSGPIWESTRAGQTVGVVTILQEHSPPITFRYPTPVFRDSPIPRRGLGLPILNRSSGHILCPHPLQMDRVSVAQRSAFIQGTRSAGRQSEQFAPERNQGTTGNEFVFDFPHHSPATIHRETFRLAGKHRPPTLTVHRGH